MTFPMTMDRVHRRMTALVCALMPLAAAAALVTIFTAPLPGRFGRVAGFAVLVAVVLPALIAAAMAPRAVELSGGMMRILRRSWSPMEIPISDITTVETGPTLGVGRSLRLGGTSGFFGSYGQFWTQGVGRYRLYTTRIGPSVMLRRKSGLPVVVGPDDPEKFRAAMDQLVGTKQRADRIGSGR